MAKIIYTDSPGRLDIEQTLWVYNGLDCCVTKEVWDKIPRPEWAKVAYEDLNEDQAPLLDMMLRGLRVDRERRDRLLAEVNLKIDRCRDIGTFYGKEVFGQPLNPNSNDQLKFILYDTMGLPVCYEKDKKTGERKASVNRDALEKLSSYIHARPICLLAIAIRDLIKERTVLNSTVDEDNYMRCSYNGAGAETFRLSSSQNCYGGGTNFQNITDEKRDMFISEPGYKFGYMDLEQAESRVVGLLAFLATGISKYLDACESGDLHTTVARMVWKNLPWTGETKKDKAIAETPFYRHFTYRDMAKRGGHGSNYNGKPYTIAKNLKVEQKLIEQFQDLYFTEFREIKLWHTDTAKRLQLDGFIDTPWGHRRHFLGRRWDDETLKEAIAHVPQSTIGMLMRKIQQKLWKEQYKIGFRLRTNDHDAVKFTYPQEREAEIIEQIKSIALIPIPCSSRKVIIPVDVKVGWNIRTASAANPLGLRKLPDERTYTSPTSVFDRGFPGIY